MYRLNLITNPLPRFSVLTPLSTKLRSPVSIRRRRSIRWLSSTAMDSAPSDDYVSVDRSTSPPLGPDIDSLVRSINSEAGDDVAIDNGIPSGGHGDVRIGNEGGSDFVVDNGSDYEAGDDVVSGEVEEERGEGDEVALPEEIFRNVVILRCDSAAEGGVCDVYLVGTAHVSQESCEEVRAVVNHLKPQVVFLELCSSRVTVLTPQDLKVPTLKEMVEMWKKKQNLFGILYSWFLAKVANQLEVFPGAEFRVAFEEALKYGGKVVLGDRPVQITLRRTWAKMPRWHKVKLIYSLLFQAVFLPSTEDLNKMLKEMDDVDMLTLVIQEMSKQYPTLMETLVHERDQYMSSTLFRVASEHKSVVAVVGKGHLQGITKNWKQAVEMKDLLHVDLPSQKGRISVVKILTTVGVAAIGSVIITGIYISSKKK